MKSAIGQRGKVAEKMVQKHLDLLNGKYMDLSYVRLPDARAAGGRLGAVICDFLVWFKGKSILLEVKQSQHAYRLPAAAISQLPTMKKVGQAGAFPFVLVFHSDLDQWRIAPIDFFCFGVPSWDLRGLDLWPTAAAALESTGVFP